jgi:hypothetical protein
LARQNRTEHLAARVIFDIALILAGVALMVFGVIANHSWFDRHFVPSFFLTRLTMMRMALGVRVALVAFGVVLAIPVRLRLARIVSRVPPRVVLGNAARISLAIMLALGAGEVIARNVERVLDREEPLRRFDARLGWSFVPSRAGHATIHGRQIEYAFDGAGYRVAHAGDSVDPDRPSVVFTGESVIVGHGLNWAETIPAQVESLTGIQSANIAVHGFAIDQAYMRLAAELPRFRQPIAVVSLFMPGLFDRNLDDNRPHLGPGLIWHPPQHSSLLFTLAEGAVPYRKVETIDRGVAVTREILQATVEMAQMRHATPIIVVPQFGQEDPSEAVLRHRVLDEAGLPYLLIELDPSWRSPGDMHPDARGAHAIAAAIAARLQKAHGMNE